MAKLGFNLVKFWVQWRWNHPQEEAFYFDDIDRLMDLAAKYKLRVMLNTIFDVAPAWLYQKYPDASMITLDGRAVAPQTQPHRQIGGLGLCFNHQEAMSHLFHFLQTTVKRYKDHPALEIWNVASEPELTSSMSEMRLYADDAALMRDMLCYCVRCQEAFRSWLATKYSHIDLLNRAWNRNYRSFREVEIPKTRNTFSDMVDWRMFFVDTLGEHVRRRFEVARTEDQGRHPLMCHHVSIQGFPITSTANDPWNVGRFGDLHGITQMDDAVMVDILRCCADGKPVISAEMLMLSGYTLQLPKPVDMNDIKRYVFTGIAANLKGFVFWQYRPETLGREAPAWGLTFLDGSPTPWLEAFAQANQVVQQNASFLLEAQAPRAEVALLYVPENQIFAWAATGSEKTATDSLLGTHRALYERNFKIDFLHPRQCQAETLARYKVIYVPFPYYLKEELCLSLKAWVERGGTLIGESYFAGWDVERGRHHTTLPGYGLHEVFKARQGIVAPPDGDGQVKIVLERDLPLIRKGEQVVGAIVKEALVPEGAEVLGRFLTGEPAVTSAQYGHGKAILIGSYVGLPYHRNGFDNNGDFIASLAEWGTQILRPHVVGGRKIRVDLLSAANGQAMLILQNLEPTSIAARLRLPWAKPERMVEQFSGEVLHLCCASRGTLASVELAPKEVKVYRA
jgi:beta-galactosidase